MRIFEFLVIFLKKLDLNCKNRRSYLFYVMGFSVQKILLFLQELLMTTLLQGRNMLIKQLAVRLKSTVFKLFIIIKFSKSLVVYLHLLAPLL